MSPAPKIECSICLECIDSTNKITTECGHTFHCNCLLKNTERNGYACPLCRTEMIEVVHNTDSDSDEEGDYEDDRDGDEGDEEQYNDDILTSLRIFNQRLDGEPIEEITDEEPTRDEGGSEWLTDDIINGHCSEVNNISEQMKRRNVSYLELMEAVLYLSHATEDYAVIDSPLVDGLAENTHNKIVGIMKSIGTLRTTYDL